MTTEHRAGRSRRRPGILTHLVFVCFGILGGKGKRVSDEDVDKLAAKRAAARESVRRKSEAARETDPRQVESEATERS